MGIKIVLDPGHYKGYNKGADKAYAEGTVMFNYAYMLKKELQKRYVVDVVVTRQKVEDNPSLTERGKMEKKADLFLSLHSNAAEPTGHGVSVFYSIKRPDDKAMAQDWCDTLAALIQGGVRSRGAMTRKGSGDWDYYTVIQSSVASGAKHSLIVEHGFHSCIDECHWLMKDENLQLMAEKEASLCAHWLGLEPIEEEEPPKPVTGWELDDDERWRFYRNGKQIYGQWVMWNGKWYYLNPDGTMAEGWTKVGQYWYFLDPENGDMQTGWLKIEDGEYKGMYYLLASGAMAIGKHTIDGVQYEFASDGKLKEEE